MLIKWVSNSQKVAHSCAMNAIVTDIGYQQEQVLRRIVRRRIKDLGWYTTLRVLSK
jgi:hypothetical protein